MLIRSFLQWAATASCEARAQGASALARAYAAGELDGAERNDAEVALTTLLDDRSPLVRLAMAIELCGSPEVPPAVLTGLMADRSDIAALVLEFSPAPSVAELVDAVATGDVVCQTAVARRRDVDIRLAAALAEVAGLDACLELCRNPDAALPSSAVDRLIARFGSHADLRSLLAERADLRPMQRYALAGSVARDLTGFASRCGWLDAERASRVAAEATDQACVTIATASSGCTAGDLAALVSHLRREAALTPALLLRSLLCGGLAFLEAALAELSGMSASRVGGLVRASRGLGFRALFERAGLPARLRPVFVAALEADPFAGTSGQLQRRRIGAALAACERAEPEGGLANVAMLLRRLDAEAARTEARAFARDAMREPGVYRLPRLSQAGRPLPLPTAA